MNCSVWKNCSNCCNSVWTNPCNNYCFNNWGHCPPFQNPWNPPCTPFPQNPCEPQPQCPLSPQPCQPQNDCLNISLPKCAIYFMAGICFNRYFNRC